MLTSLRVTIVAGEKQNYYVFLLCVCSLSYLACKTHAPYCVVCSLYGCTTCVQILAVPHVSTLWLYHMCPHYGCTTCVHIMAVPHVSTLWLYHMCLHYLINVTTFGKTLSDIKYEFLFFPQIFSEAFLILRRIKRGIIINVYSCEVPGILVGF